jgi:hypothetical protein
VAHHAEADDELRHALRLLCAAQERDDLIVKFNIDTGTIDPNTTQLYKANKTTFQPRISASFAPNDKTAIRAWFRASWSDRDRPKT